MDGLNFGMLQNVHNTGMCYLRTYTSICLGICYYADVCGSCCCCYSISSCIQPSYLKERTKLKMLT